MLISIIAAVGEDREIGANNQLLWHIPGELPRFKRITMGHPLIMGRKTFESIGKPLPGRTNIVITRDHAYQHEGIVVVNSLQQALEKATAIEEARIRNHAMAPSSRGEASKSNENVNDSQFITLDSGKSEVFIIGGGQIFTEAMPLVDRLYLTVVHKAFPHADIFFPEYAEFTKIIDKEERESPEYSYTFFTLEKE